VALVGMSSAGKEMGNQERKRVVDDIESESESVLQQYTYGSETAFELGTNLATTKGLRAPPRRGTSHLATCAGSAGRRHGPEGGLRRLRIFLPSRI
jgi:hypothetical protein